jgi:aminopeptidase N
VVKTLVDSRAASDTILKFMSQEQRTRYLPLISALAMKKLKTAPPGGDGQLIWLQALLDSANSSEETDFIQKLLSGKAHISGLKIDQEVRWYLVQALARMGTPGAEDMIAAELKSDATDMGKKMSIEAQVQIPDLKIKTSWANQIFAAEKTPATADIRKAMSAFYVFNQDSLSEQFVDRYFSELPQAMKSSDEEYVDYYSDSFFPALCSQKVVDLTTQALKSILPSPAIRNLKINRQEAERCLRALSASAPAAVK